MAKKKKDEATAIPLRQIHVLRGLLAAGGRAYKPGDTLVVGQDINEIVARQWIAVGIAEEDKILAGAPEIK